MNLDALQTKLLNAARKAGPDEKVPFGFERRVMERIIAAPLPDVWLLWSRALWRAAVSCVVLAFCFGLWSRFETAAPQPVTYDSLPATLEHTVLAELNANLADVW